MQSTAQRKFALSAPPGMTAGLPREVVISADAQGNPTKTLPVFYFTKDLLRLGHYEHPIERWTLDVTPEAIDGYVSIFDQMMAAGVKVPFVVDHSDDADDGRGQVLRMWHENDTLQGLICVVGEDAATAIARVPEVSVCVNHIIDGTGKDFGEGIEHVSHSQFPVLPKQEPFKPLAASRRRTAKTLSAALRSNVMALKPDLKEKLQAKIVATGKTVEEAAGMSDDDLVQWGLESWLGEGEGAPEDSAQVQTLTREKADLSTKVGELTEQVKTLSRKGDAPPPNEEVLLERSIRMKGKVEQLVADHKIDPATGEKLFSRLVKSATGKPNAMMLSRHGDDTDCLAAEIFALFAANNPPPKGEKTGPQVRDLSRSSPGTEPDAQADGAKEGVAFQQQKLKARGLAAV